MIKLNRLNRGNTAACCRLIILDRNIVTKCLVLTEKKNIVSFIYNGQIITATVSKERYLMKIAKPKLPDTPKKNILAEIFYKIAQVYL